MNLLKESWIPVRPAKGGVTEHITLQALLCEPASRVLSLPRDDMELAAYQLLVSIVQLIWPPKDLPALTHRIAHPLDNMTFNAGVADWQDAFDLSHPKTPFMQVRGVKAKDITRMDKLMVGLTGSTNCAFINQPGQADALCGGCTAIALFNQAGNAPGFGGGFKSGLRGGTPITTLIRRSCLRTTLWSNVLTQACLATHYPGWQAARSCQDAFTWEEPIIADETITAETIGLARGLFWQPAHIELSPAQHGGPCSACGASVAQRYHSFLKEKFNFSVEGFWLHPHSPSVLHSSKKASSWRHLAFTRAAPSWTYMDAMLVEQQGISRPALTVQQAQQLLSGKALHLHIGGYRNNQAAILERRHEIKVFNCGWEKHLDVIAEIVRVGQCYRQTLNKAFLTFIDGIKIRNVIGAGVPVYETVERQYYRQSDCLIASLLASLNDQPHDAALAQLHESLAALCQRLFDIATKSYAHHCKLSRTLMFARHRVLPKQLTKYQMQGGLIRSVSS